MKYKVLLFEEQSLGDDRLILPVINGLSDITRACYLDSTAAIIWDKCKTYPELIDINDLAEWMTHIYSVEHNIVLADLYDFFEPLLENNLVSKED